MGTQVILERFYDQECCRDVRVIGHGNRLCLSENPTHVEIRIGERWMTLDNFTYECPSCGEVKDV